MPQMAPLQWLILFIFFSLFFMLFNIMNYYNFSLLSKSTNNKLNITNKSLNWKW